jgi:hypothetical protein
LAYLALIIGEYTLHYYSNPQILFKTDIKEIWDPFGGRGRIHVHRIDPKISEIKSKTKNIFWEN